MTTKFTNQCSWQFSKNHSQKALNLENKRETPHYILTRHEPMAPTLYPPKAGHHIPYATSPKPTDKDHDKYQHVQTFSDETIITLS